MGLYLVQGSISTVTVALLIHFMMVIVALLQPVHVGGALVRADSPRHNNVWRRGTLCYRQECDFRYGGQKNFHSQVCGSKPILSDGSCSTRSPSAALIAAAHQSEVMSTRPRSRALRRQNSSFWEMSGKSIENSRQEVAVLVSLKAAVMEDPLGVLESWNPNSSTACDWVGVSCSLLDDGEHVTALDLSGSQLVGDLDLILAALARLDSLEHLDFSVNEFYGSLVGPALTNMSSLQYLNLSSNRVRGSIPSGIGKLRGLRVLSLSANNLTSGIPGSIGNCSNLTALELGANLLTGSIPDVFGNTLRLQLLDIGNLIPAIIYSFFSPVGNSLLGPFPSSLGNCSKLLHLDIKGNPGIGGDVPLELSLLTDLQVLDISWCSFTGPLRNWWGNMTNLRQLNIRYNLLSGEIPDSLWNLSNLEELVASANSLSGGLPEFATNSTSLALVSLSYNNLTGDISNLFLESLSRSLMVFIVSDNFFTGVIPSSLANCSALQVLSLGGNPFDQQNIPEWIGVLSSLTYLALGDCDLWGEIPKEIGQLQNLDVISIGGNTLTGVIPSEFSNCTSVRLFHVESNQLTGAIPPELGQLSNLEDISANDNNLTGSIPPSLTNLTSLAVMELSDNFFSGRIDDLNWGQMSQLYYFRLYGNQLLGSVPTSFGNYSELWYLDVGGNHLTGHIPASLTSNLSHVPSLVIDLSFNDLSGKLPPSLFQSPQVVVLYLAENDLEGTLPSEVGESFNLETLDLSRTRLEKELPESLGNCSKLSTLYFDGNRFSGNLSSRLLQRLVHLRYVDVSNNLFSGPWPQELSSLQDIQFLNLSRNNFSGSIMGPPAGSMLVLETLDVSLNNFDSAIPAFLGRLPELNFINLSYNNFQGPIPNTGIFVHNATNASFLGNPGLCGTLLGLVRKCPPQASTPLPTAGGSCKGFVHCRRAWFIATCGVLGAFLAVAVVLVLWWERVKRGARQRKQNVTFDLGTHFKQINGSEIRSMIIHAQVIGRGASSVVYKGSSPEGETFAIKVLNSSNALSDTKDTSACRHDQEQLLQEVHTLAQLRHRNILKVLNFCSGWDMEAIILEYMPQGSLHKHLYASEGDVCQLLFQTRLRIAIGVAEGMKYMHHDLPSPLIHGDLKPTNILLDQDFTAKVADFGISKFVHQMQGGESVDQGGQNVNASASTVHVCGTPGYIPPEYASEGRVSTRGDVYSYGVVLLELLTGRPPTEDFIDNNPMLHATHSTQGARARSIHGNEGSSFPSGGYRSQILNLYNDNSLQMLDTKLLEDSTLDSTKREQLKLLMLLALLCTRNRSQSRPTMLDISTILAQIQGMGNNLDAARKTIEELVHEDPPAEDNDVYDSI